MHCITKHQPKPNSTFTTSHLDISIQNCISSLLKDPSSRTPLDISFIQSFLETTDLSYKLPSSNLLTTCSTQMKHLYLKSNTTLFKIGDKGDNFYIIIHGCINILKPVSKVITTSPYEYFEYVYNLYNSNELYLLNQTINSNKHLVDITTDELAVYEKDKRKIILSRSYKIEFTIYEYKSFLHLGKGAFFGDSALDKQTTRNATIITTDDTHFCYLHCKDYNSFLKHEKQRITFNEIHFLLDNFFFVEL